MHYKVGTRGSILALTQTNSVIEKLQIANPMDTYEIVVIKTKGDQRLDIPLHKLAGAGVFVKRVEDTLLRHEIDFAIHSMKDMPSQLPDGLCLCDAWKGEDPRDVLVLNRNIFPNKKRIVATGSLRRKALLKEYDEHIEVVEIRGNVDRRIKIMNEQGYDGLILAAAGLHRLQKKDQIDRYFDPTQFIPACTQGILAIEIRKEDIELKQKLEVFKDEDTNLRMQSERAFLATMNIGCQFPIGAYLQVHQDHLCLYGMIGSLDGKILVKDVIEGRKDQAVELGVALAKRLLEKDVI